MWEALDGRILDSQKYHEVSLVSKEKIRLKKLTGPGALHYEGERFSDETEALAIGGSAGKYNLPPLDSAHNCRQHGALGWGGGRG
jgi:hypothetical protein